MSKQNCGFLILDRKGEYIEDTIDQRGNTVFGLHNHPKAREKMVIVSRREQFSKIRAGGLVHDYLKPHFNIKDIDPVDLADFLRGLTSTQADLIRDYAHIPLFYEKVLAEDHLGWVDKSHWYTDFPGLFDLKKEGKKVLSEIKKKTRSEGRTDLTEDECMDIQEHLGGSKPDVLERIIKSIRRFCSNPFFGSSQKGADILNAPSCVDTILSYLSEGKFVFLDMRGRSDEEYTMIGALFARKLLTVNKERDDDDQIRACIVMEEAHNILSADELKKGESGNGSVFIELAREGRSFKLGFVLVTQQPDARSIDPQVVSTIDTVVAFNMPPSNAKQLQHLKTGFEDLDWEISNAREFRGVAISDSGPISFQSAIVDVPFMKSCVDGELEMNFKSKGDAELTVTSERDIPTPPSLEERLATLMRNRQEDIQPIALATMKAWGRESLTEDSEDLPF